jgi:hypothetical protein
MGTFLISALALHSAHDWGGNEECPHFRFGVRLWGIENNESAVGKNMKGRVTIGLVGDRNDSVPAHLAIPLALENSAAELGITAAYEWVPTDRIRSASAEMRNVPISDFTERPRDQSGGSAGIAAATSGMLT